MKTKASTILILLIFNCNRILSINYYVKSTGSDFINSGLSPTTPFKTIQRAADLTLPGDTVFVMNGTYTNDCDECSVVSINRSGNSIGWIVYTNYPEHKPLIKFNGSDGISLIDGAHHIEISGFRIKGNIKNVTLEEALNQPGGCNDLGGIPLGKFNGVGIASRGSYTIHSHHLRILNNIIFECGEAGISAQHCDYIRIEGNVIYNNCWTGIYGSSGISIYQLWNFDNNMAGYRNYITNNICYGNRLFVPWFGAPCEILDGNGIIMDDCQNKDGNSTQGPYKGRTYIYNNICFKNGGSGVHTYQSDRVDIVNNTAYKNSQSIEVNNGEIFASDCRDVNIYNNILYALPGNKINSNFSNINCDYDYNLYFGDGEIEIVGPNSIIADPAFVNESLNLTSANFHLNSGSPAINSGTFSKAPQTDFDGTVRSFQGGIDIGAFESTQQTFAKFWLEEKIVLEEISIFPNPAKDQIMVSGLDNCNEIKIFDCTGKLVSTCFTSNTQISIDTKNFNSGLYYLNTGNSSIKFLKE
jgi:parallel beta-helix repeat protein